MRMEGLVAVAASLFLCGNLARGCGEAEAALPIAAPAWAQRGPIVGEERADSVTCLAEAISYEAGSEGEAGQAAVAQVVLNRLRDPRFPKTVCDVVFQGAARPGGGCQFTFACDGSLTRRRPGRSWPDALRLAERAMDGTLVSAVGDATHYHAYYVQPAWAARMTRVARVGAHIFYDSAAVATAASAPVPAVATPPAPRAVTVTMWGLNTAVLTPVGNGIAINRE